MNKEMIQTQQHSIPPPEQSDAPLIARCRTGDIQAFEALYNKYKARLYSYAYRFHGNAQDAEDSVQDAFIAMYRKIGSFREEAKLSTWLFKIISNACLSRKRLQRHSEEPKDFLDDYYHPVHHHDHGDAALCVILEKEIALLPEMHRAVFLLFANQGFRHEEIAGMLSIGIGTSKSYYHRAKEKLKDRLLHRGINLTEVTA
jgi:RNA polymerase sigma-70 factor, ECF subfamily